MFPENIYKEKLIDNLNRINKGWIDGDKEKNSRKTADIVNHTLKMVIEIKDDTKYKLPKPPPGGGMVTSGHDLTKMNQRLSDHLKSANAKFKSYPGYKTILLIRTDFIIVDVLCYAIKGLHRYSKVGGELKYTGRTGKYSTYIRKEIGGFLIVSDAYYYFPNQYALPQRIVTRDEIQSILGKEVKEIKDH